MTVPPIIQGANYLTSGFNYISHDSSANYASHYPHPIQPHMTRHIEPGLPIPPADIRRRPRGFSLHSLGGSVTTNFGKVPNNAPPAVESTSRTVLGRADVLGSTSIAARRARAAPPQSRAMHGVQRAPMVLSLSRAPSSAGSSATEQARPQTPSSLYTHDPRPLATELYTAQQDPSTAPETTTRLRDDVAAAPAQSTMRHRLHLNQYMVDGRLIAAPQPVSASTHFTHDSGYAGTTCTDMLGLQLPSRAQLPFAEALAQSLSDSHPVGERHEGRLTSVNDPPPSRFNRRLRKLSPPAIQLCPRTPPPSCSPMPDTSEDTDHIRDDVSALYYPPTGYIPESAIREQPALLLGGPVIPGVNVPAPPPMHSMPPPGFHVPQAWGTIPAAQPAALHGVLAMQSPQQPPPLIQRCAELPPVTATPPWHHTELPPMYSPPARSEERKLSLAPTDWTFTPPDLTSPVKDSSRSRTLHTNTQLATPEKSSISPLPPASPLCDVPMAVDSPAPLSPLEIRFERSPYADLEAMAARCATVVGDMRWVLGSCRELALHETTAVIEGLVGAVLAVRAALVDAPEDLSVLEEQHEWAGTYDLLLLSCRRNLDLLTLQAEHVRDRPPRINKISALLDKLWRYVEKFEDLERKLRIVHDHIRMLQLHSHLRHSRDAAAVEAAAQRARRRAYTDAQNEARDHRREVRAEIRRTRDDARARKEIWVERKMRRADALGESFAV